MKTITIENNITREIIFSHECENNNIKLTVMEALKNVADLSDANLSDAIIRNLRAGNKKEILTMQTNIFNIAMTKGVIAIGCQQYTVERWDGMSEKEVEKMDINALSFMRKWKDTIFKIHTLSFK